MTLQIIHIVLLVASGLAAVSLCIRAGVRIARRVRPGLDPKATEGVVLRILGDTAGYTYLLLVPAG